MNKNTRAALHVRRPKLYVVTRYKKKTIQDDTALQVVTGYKKKQYKIQEQHFLLLLKT